MGFRVLKQPNGRYATYSSNHGKTFYQVNLTQEGVVAEYVEAAARSARLSAEFAIKEADEGKIHPPGPTDTREALFEMEQFHPPSVVEAYEQMITLPPDDPKQAEILRGLIEAGVLEEDDS